MQPATPGRGGVGYPACIYCPAAQYSSAGTTGRVQGSVELDVVITADGHPAKITVLRGLPCGMSDAAMKAVEQWRFRPCDRQRWKTGRSFRNRGSHLLPVLMFAALVPTPPCQPAELKTSPHFTVQRMVNSGSMRRRAGWKREMKRNFVLLPVVTTAPSRTRAPLGRAA